MNEAAAIFKPTDITIQLGETTRRLVYDLNAFCELEKMYESVDGVLQMLLGTTNIPDLEMVTYRDDKVDVDDIKIAGVALALYIKKINNVKTARHTDTLNLLWVGCLHDTAVYDAHGEISGYGITKAELGAAVSFKNLQEVNAKIITAILRDLIPSDQVKNAEAPEEVKEAETPRLELHK